MPTLLANSTSALFNYTVTTGVALISESPTPFPSPQPPDDETPNFLINFLLTILFSLIAPCFVCQWWFQRPVGLDEALYLIYLSIFAWTRIPEYAFRTTQNILGNPALQRFWSVYMMQLGPIIGLEGLFSLYHAWSYYVTKAHPPLTTRVVFTSFRILLWAGSILCCVGPLLTYLEYVNETSVKISYFMNTLSWALYEVCCLMFVFAVGSFKIHNGEAADNMRFFLLFIPGVLFLWDNTYDVLLAISPLYDFRYSFYIMTTIPEIIICIVILFANVVRRFKFENAIPFPSISHTVGEVWTKVSPKKGGVVPSVEAERQPLLRASEIDTISVEEDS